MQRFEFGHSEVQGRQRHRRRGAVAQTPPPLDRDAGGDEPVHVAVDRAQRGAQTGREILGAVQPSVAQDPDHFDKPVGSGHGRSF